MPELPEVETIVSDLRPQVQGRQITGVRSLSPEIWELPADVDGCSLILGTRVVAVQRRGKLIVIGLDNGWHLLIHLRMTGQLLLLPPAPAPRYARACFELDQSLALWFCDVRRFGRITVTSDLNTALGRLGPEPLSAQFDASFLARRLHFARRSIKSALLDQSVAAGIGNIYADEALFVARIHPATRACSLTGEQFQELAAAIKATLQCAINNRGTTVANYVDANGNPGHHQYALNVYRREGKPCPICETPIQRSRIAGRSSYFCPRCQPHNEAARAMPPEPRQRSTCQC
jgi:formamidopyrimidine-DNA glycosylase